MAKKILLADDSLTIQKVVELTFSDGDYDLVCVSNGQKALERVRQDRPDLILADVVMPEKNGYEVCEAIKGDPGTARIPVVLLSGTFEPFDRERAERLGCDAIVSKPFDSQQLISQVEALLGRIRGEAAEAEPPPSHAGSAAAEEESGRAPFESGFDSEDFTASIRMPRQPERADPFEEEYGRGDVDSAIRAFERAHPEFAGAAAVSSGNDGDNALRGEAAAAPWLVEDAEPAASSASPRGPRGGVWMSGEEEPDQPLDFDAEHSGAFRQDRRADEGPTQEIPRQTFGAERLYPSEPSSGVYGRPAGAGSGEMPWGAQRPEPEEISADDAEVLFDVSADGDGDEEETREMPASLSMVSGGDGGSVRTGAPSVVEPLEPHPIDGPSNSSAVSPELEALAQTASIPELTTMLSSVMRSGSDLSDAEIDRLAQRVVEKLSDKIVREIAWEVIPDMAEIVIKERIKELESGVE